MRLSKTDVDKSLKLYLGNTMLEEVFIHNLIVQKNNGMYVTGETSKRLNENHKTTYITKM